MLIGVNSAKLGKFSHKTIRCGAFEAANLSPYLNGFNSLDLRMNLTLYLILYLSRSHSVFRSRMT